MKFGGQSISWPTKIDFDYSNINYTMGLKTVERFGFSKGGGTRVFHPGAAAYCQAALILIVDTHILKENK